MDPMHRYAVDIDSYQDLNRCKVTLHKKELWKEFCENTTEMIITKSGRRMFPTMAIRITDLNPGVQYCIFVEITPSANCRYRFSAVNGWTPAGSEEAHSPHKLYLHPESPATGEHWMQQGVSFGRLKLTNTLNPPLGHIVLASMHKYQPRIIIVKTADPRTALWAPSVTVSFPETQFIAVTAYQNDKITKLKIDNNPFAKGFRENGQAAKSKRKRSISEEDEENEEDRSRKIPIEERLYPRRTKTPEEVESVCSSSPRVSSVSPGSNFSNPCLAPQVATSSTYLPYCYPQPGFNSFCLPPYFYYNYNQGSLYPANLYSRPATGHYYPGHVIPEKSTPAPSANTNPPKKLTDFSIRAITGTS